MALGFLKRRLTSGAEAPVTEAGRVRPFAPDDISRVADLHRRVFRVEDRDQRAGGGGSLSPRLLASYEAYFNDAFLDGPWQHRRITSLVYEDRDGRIVGFLGVLPRRMMLDDTPVQMAVCSQFAVDPQRRGMVGLELLSEHFRGPQDLSVTDEANDATRRIWEARGGTTCPSYCVHWIRPLRPAAFLLSVAGGIRGAARVLGPISRIADAIAAKLPGSPFRRAAQDAPGEDLDTPTVLEHLPIFAKGRSFLPDYTAGSWSWTLARAGLRDGDGRFHKVALRDTARRLAGWYLYRLEPGAVAEVLQIAATARSFNGVFGHLLEHAWRRGAVAVSGRLDPILFRELADRYCLFRFRGSSMLVHAAKPAVLQPLYQGDAFFTRLEGEWCLRFRPDW
jgi:hypothetical protein